MLIQKNVESRKMIQMNLFAGQKQRLRHREWTCEHGVGEGMNWEIGIDICALPRVKQIASGNVLYSAGSSARCSVVTQMNAMERVLGGRSKTEGMYVCIVQQKLIQHCKATIPQFFFKKVPHWKDFLIILKASIHYFQLPGLL